MPRQTDPKPNDTSVTFLKAILLALLDSRPETAREKPEVLLHRAGVPNDQIADLLGKKEDAIRKALSRAKSR